MENNQDKSSGYVSFENRRKFPRLKMNLPIIITTVNNEKIKGTLYDISPDGAQIRYASKDGIKIFQHQKLPATDINACKCTLQFDLAYSESVTHVRISACPVYLRPVTNDILASGIFFSEDNLSENKKISDFLFYQLQVSFAEIEYIHQDNNENKKGPELTVQKTVLEKKHPSDNSAEEKIMPAEMEELILQMDYPKEQHELLRDLLFRVLSSLKAIHETTRHIDERINLLEHKISRKK